MQFTDEYGNSHMLGWSGVGLQFLTRNQKQEWQKLFRAFLIVFFAHYG